ncbi:MAG: hypothetical protein JXA93_17410 [Anaerolineae bacterium]|nr:hypothetical protein [Anaerolineae bacterium]
MIEMLLWRCPVCERDDALGHEVRRWRADRVWCRACGAEWRLRRVPGDNYYLRLVMDRDSKRAATRDERSITAWYDALKATVRLAPVADPAVDLAAGESLYLASQAAELIAQEDDPLFFPATARDGTPGDGSRQPARGRPAGRGRLFLTNRRLIWQGETHNASWPLARLNSAYAFLDHGVMLMVDMRLYTVHFLAESLLKWVTHIALVASQVEAETGHRIATSNF